MKPENGKKLDKQVYKSSLTGGSPTKGKNSFDVKDLGIAGPTEGKTKGKLTTDYEKLNQSGATADKSDLFEDSF